MSKDKDLIPADKRDIISIDDANSNKSNNNIENKFTKFFKKPSTIIILILLLGWGITYLFMNYTHNKKVRTIEKAANEQIFDQDIKWLKRAVRTLGWAVISEYGESPSGISYNRHIAGYLKDLAEPSDIATPTITKLMIINKNGEIIMSTNASYEGRAFSRHYNQRFLQENDTYFEANHDKRQVNISEPITIRNRREGTLFLVYEADKDTYFSIESVE